MVRGRLCQAWRRDSRGARTDQPHGCDRGAVSQPDRSGPAAAGPARRFHPQSGGRPSSVEEHHGRGLRPVGGACPAGGAGRFRLRGERHPPGLGGSPAAHRGGDRPRLAATRAVGPALRGAARRRPPPGLVDGGLRTQHPIQCHAAARSGRGARLRQLLGLPASTGAHLPVTGRTVSPVHAGPSAAHAWRQSRDGPHHARHAGAWRRRAGGRPRLLPALRQVALGQSTVGRHPAHPGRPGPGRSGSKGGGAATEAVFHPVAGAQPDRGVAIAAHCARPAATRRQARLPDRGGRPVR